MKYWDITVAHNISSQYMPSKPVMPWKFFFFFWMGNTQTFYTKRWNEDTSFARASVLAQHGMKVETNQNSSFFHVQRKMVLWVFSASKTTPLMTNLLSCGDCVCHVCNGGGADLVQHGLHGPSHTLMRSRHIKKHIWP